MEKQFEAIEQATKKIIVEAGLQSPPANFVSNVLQHIEVKQVSEILYRPLITKKGWFVVASVVGVAVIVLVLFPFSETFFSSVLQVPGSLNFSIPTLELPKTSLYAFGVLLLFILQIPILKRYFVK